MIPTKVNRVIDNETGDKLILCGFTVSSSGCYYTLFSTKLRSTIKVDSKEVEGEWWNDKEANEEKKKRYTIIDKEAGLEDITKEQIVSYLGEVNQLGLLDVIKRRLCPDYYEEGALVYFTIPGYIPYNREAYGPEYPFLITENRKIVGFDYKTSEFKFIVVVKRYDPSKGRDISLYDDNYNGISIESDLTLYQKEDCYTLLSRYDKEY